MKKTTELLQILVDLRKAPFHADKTTVDGREAGVHVRSQVIDSIADLMRQLIDVPAAVE